jgi:cell division protein FtsN
VLSPLATQSHLYRVRLGPITSVAQFDELSARLNALGISDARLAPD